MKRRRTSLTGLLLQCLDSVKGACVRSAVRHFLETQRGGGKGGNRALVYTSSGKYRILGMDATRDPGFAM